MSRGEGQINVQGEGLNWWHQDPHLQASVAGYCSAAMWAWAEPHLARFGGLCGTAISQRAAWTDRQEGRPRLVSYDRQGQEISEVRYNPGYIETLADSYGSGVVAWRHGMPAGAPGPVPTAVTYAMGYMLSMAEVGVYCPVTLTAAAALIVERHAPADIRERYLSHLTTTDPAHLMQGATWLTEKTGGSDVGAITTLARQEGDVWRLTGEKWFASNADAPVALVLARPEGAKPGTAGLGLFLVPRTLPDGERNSYRIRRLKEKLGVIAVPSGEVLLEGAVGYLIGGPGQGFKIMMEGINLSRIMNAIGSAGLARRAFLESACYTQDRITFGKPLNQHPLMRANLLDMLLDVTVCTTLAFRAADRFEADEPVHRLLIPIVKARTAERALLLARKAIECHGGNGYIEEYVTPRLLRDAQVLTVWEGPENILALDLLRVLAKQGPGYFLAEVEACLRGAPAELVTERLAVVRQLECFQASLAILAGLDGPMAELQAVPLLHRMADLLTSACLLEQATQPHGRAMLQLYLDRLQPVGTGQPTRSQRMTLAQFDVLMQGAIPVLAKGEDRHVSV